MRYDDDVVLYDGDAHFLITDPKTINIGNMDRQTKEFAWKLFQKLTQNERSEVIVGACLLLNRAVLRDRVTELVAEVGQ
jgi:hypothetical protein